MRLWEEVASAQKRIRNAILRTPLIYSDTFSAMTGKEVFLKLENLQKGGSFKIRGAYNKLSQIDPAVRRRGVVAASAGNHAQGVAIASALLANKKKTRPKKVVLLISGGNIDVNLLDRIIEKGLSQTGRMVRLAVLLRDIPGSLSRLTRLMAEHHANILHIVHERADRDIPIGFTRVILVLETRGPDHIREIQEGLRNSGCVLQFRKSKNIPSL